MEDRFARIRRMQEGVVRALADEVQRWMQELLTEAIDPVSFIRFAEGLGIDLSSMKGMIGKQDGLDPYRVLGLERTDTDEVVKQRYRQLLMKLHPDTAGVKGTEFLVQMVMVSYEQISKERGWR